MATHFEESRLIPGVDVQTAYDVVLRAPLPEVFAKRHGPMPRITEVRDQVGEWGTEVGETRRIHMSDGGSVLERLTEVDAPRSFAYTLSEVTGPMKMLVGALRGRWSFAAEGGGTRVTWAWDIDPKSTVAAMVLPILRLFWKGYAAKALASAEQRVRR